MTFEPIPGSDVDDLLQQLLRHDPKITNEVGDRIRPGALEQGDMMPAIVYDVVARDVQTHLGGPAGYSFSRIQFTSYGDSKEQAKRVAKQVYNCLHGFTGDLDASHHVDDCMLDNEYDRRDPPSDGSSKFRFRRVQDYLISHTEPVPTGLGV